MAIPYKICFLGYKMLGQLARKVIDELSFTDTEIVLKECAMANFSATVDDAAAAGCEVFIAGSANAAMFKSRESGHLVELNIDFMDWLLSVRRAVSIGCLKPAIALYRDSVTVDTNLLSELCGVPVSLITYEDTAELYSAISVLQPDAVIGASLACEVAEHLGRKSILAYAGEDTIRNTILSARNLAIELRNEAKDSEVSRAILSQSPSGIIVTDENGVITTFNASARKMTSLYDTRLLGRRLEDVIPVLSYENFVRSDQKHISKNRLLNGVMIRCTQTKLESSGHTVGMLITLFPDNSRKKKENPEAVKGFSAKYTWKDIVAVSPAMQETVAWAKTCSHQEHPIMIKGASGSGKGFISRCIHSGSTHASEPFIVINAASISSLDASRELFGFESGEGTRQGYFELAGSGTVVIQNLSGSSEATQACFLQVLTEKSFNRVGGHSPVPFSAHIISIVSDSDRERILPDLWERLSVFTVNMPELSARAEDIESLFRMFLLQEPGISRYHPQSELTDLLCAYSWPGNLAELSAVCKRYALFLSQAVNPTPGARHQMLIDAIGEDRILDCIISKYPALGNPSASSPKEVEEGISVMKKLLRYNNSTAAEKLGIGRTTLWRILKPVEIPAIPDSEDGD